MMMKMVATCLLGIEGLVADDLKSMDAQNVCAQNGRVFFDGDETILARANIWSRYAERILIVDGNRPVDTIANDIWAQVSALYS